MARHSAANAKPSDDADAAGAAVQFPMSDRDFVRVAERIRRMAGIVLEPHKRQMIVSRLGRRLRATGTASFAAYLDRLDEGRDMAELQEFVDALTTNLTSFFREMHHFDHFERAVAGPAQSRGATRLRVWSAGCSSGEEPYSVAVTLLEALGRIPPDFRILATDLDSRVLATARQAVYPQDKIKGIPPRFARHFGPGPEPGTTMPPPAARSAVQFRHLNLQEDWPMRGPFDAIFCRNVMIYFGPETKAALISRFADLLVPGGFLYLGHSEAILGSHPLIEPCGTTTYRRKS